MARWWRRSGARGPRLVPGAGQTRPVTVYRLVTRGTIESRIVEPDHDKRTLAEGILAGGEAAALPATEDLNARIRGV